MINFSLVSPDSLIGSGIRAIISGIPPGLQVRVLQGPMRGFRWAFGSGNPGYWLGSYKLTKQKKLMEFLKEGTVFYDLGAHVGFFTLLASCLVGDHGQIVAFEPNPENVKYLNKHIEWNQRKNVLVIEAAIGDQVSLVGFDPSLHSSMGSVSRSYDGRMTVQMLTLDYLYKHSGIPAPHIMKIDVEGSECAALNGARKLISESRPVIFVSTHGDGLREGCVSLLREFDYRLDCVGDDPEEIIAIPSG
jgi:FkbM family methyltransferase